MKQLNLWVLLIGLNLINILCLGQARPTPAEVTNTFNKMFPDASDLQWKDKITNFSAFFNIKGIRCEAKFTPAGSWISTEEAIQWDSLPPLVDLVLALGQQGGRIHPAKGVSPDVQAAVLLESSL